MPALLIVVTIAASFWLGRVSFNWHSPALEPADLEINETATHYRFISPLLQCEAFSPPSIEKVQRAEEAATDVASAAEAAGDAAVVSVYFRDLNNGPWFGINEEYPFLPASLLKVPVLMAYLHAADSDPEVFDMSIVYDGTSYQDIQNFVSGPPMEAGRKYSVRELLERLIKSSDNTAMVLLLSDRLLPIRVLDEVYKDIGIGSPVKALHYEINAITYSRFLRILYNATYISREMSEYSLGLLAQSGFEQGIRAGVASNVVVAHKFGERFVEQTGQRQLHDCGIIYAQENPYLLCVMTQGREFSRLVEVIAGVSRAVYQAVTAAP